MSVESYVQGLAKPKCACTFNGRYLEDVVPGYRTSYVEGRDSYEADLEELTSKRIHGARYRSMKERTRDLRIHFNLHANNEENYQKRCNAIRGFLLQNRQVKIIFNDESDVYYIGSAKSLQFSKFVNAYNSNCTMTIHCATPFKYSVQTYVVEPSMDPATDGGTDYTTFVVDYDGTWRSYPTFVTNFFYSETPDDNSGDCGYVAFVNQNRKILQFGNPKETSTGEEVGEDVTTPTSKTISEALINQTFNNGSKNYGWTVNGSNVKYVTGGGKDVKLGSAGVSNKNFGNSTVMKPTNYGSIDGYHYHGPYLTKVIPNDSTGSGNNNNPGAIDWTVQVTHVLAADTNKSNCNKSRGAFEICIHNGTKIIAAVSIMKNHASTEGNVWFVVDGKNVGSMTVDLSHNSTAYGFGKNANRTTSITKKGSSFTFNIAGTKKTFKVESMKNVKATICQMAFHVREGAGSKNRPPIKDNVVYSFKFTKNNIVKTIDTQADASQDNTFNTNDKLTVDCEDAYVYLGKQVTPYEEGGETPVGEHAPELGALGNDWETFYLEPGINQIRVSYSEWVTAAHQPQFIMKYKKVYI